VLGIGRANSILSPKNKFIKTAVLYCWSASVVDAISKAVRTLGNIPLKTTPDKKEIVIAEEINENRDGQVYFTDTDSLKYASEKQKNLLSKLISRCKDSSKKEYENKLESPYLSSFEASSLIKTLLTKK
jgi:hypothetical protein